jgi:hypothetical protein
MPLTQSRELPDRKLFVAVRLKTLIDIESRIFN